MSKMPVTTVGLRMRSASTVVPSPPCTTKASICRESTPRSVLLHYYYCCCCCCCCCCCYHCCCCYCCRCCCCCYCLPEEHAKVRALRLEQLARRGELVHLRLERRGHGVGLPLADVEQREVVLALEEHLHRGLEARRARHLLYFACAQAAAACTQAAAVHIQAAAACEG
eukprot:scaffold15211_cov60-Phaeocystis_antarctica.AAC.2